MSKLRRTVGLVAIAGLMAVAAIGLTSTGVSANPLMTTSPPSAPSGCHWDQLVTTRGSQSVFSAYDGSSGWVKGDVTAYNSYTNDLRRSFCGQTTVRISVFLEGFYNPDLYMYASARVWSCGSYAGQWNSPYVTHTGSIAYFTPLISTCGYIGADNLYSQAAGMFQFDNINPSPAYPYAGF
jgi:hypothetical protein